MSPRILYTTLLACALSICSAEILPRVAYSMMLACAFGACSEEEPKEPACQCGPQISEPTQVTLCNNATFQWTVNTLLEEISRLKDQEAESNKKVYEWQSKLADQSRQHEQQSQLYQHVQQDAIQCTDSLAQMQADNHRLRAQVKTLTGENERLKSAAAKTSVSKPRDCSDIKRRGLRSSGLYTVYPESYRNGLEVFCDLDNDGGGWTVIHRRQDGTQSFERSWQSYKEGFGQAAREFWLGNEKIYHLTKSQAYELRIDMLDFDGKHAYALYDKFHLEDESQAYTLRLGDYFGTAGDGLGHHRDSKFSTLDVDNDLSRSGHCSQLYGNGGWWFVRCYDSNLNGVYYTDGEAEHKDGVIWYQLNDSRRPLLHVEMKIRPAHFSS